MGEARPEHVQTGAWPNEASSAFFSHVKIEAIRAGDSEPALLLTLILGPSEEAREIGRLKEGLVGRHHLREWLWDGLHDSGGHIYIDPGPEFKARKTRIFDPTRTPARAV